jgi:hypothetical protein
MQPLVRAKLRSRPRGAVILTSMSTAVAVAGKPKITRAMLGSWCSEGVSKLRCHKCRRLWRARSARTKVPGAGATQSTSGCQLGLTPAAGVATTALTTTRAWTGTAGAVALPTPCCRGVGGVSQTFLAAENMLYHRAGCFRKVEIETASKLGGPMYTNKSLGSSCGAHRRLSTHS